MRRSASHRLSPCALASASALLCALAPGCWGSHGDSPDREAPDASDDAREACYTLIDDGLGGYFRALPHPDGVELTHLDGEDDILAQGLLTTVAPGAGQRFLPSYDGGLWIALVSGREPLSVFDQPLVASAPGNVLVAHVAGDGKLEHSIELAAEPWPPPLTASNVPTISLGDVTSSRSGELLLGVGVHSQLELDGQRFTGTPRTGQMPEPARVAVKLDVSGNVQWARELSYGTLALFADDARDRLTIHGPSGA